MSGSGNPTFALAGVAMTRLLAGGDTAGQFCLFENESAGNTQTPIHVHADDDETLYVIAGEMTAVLDGVPRRLAAGESIFLPRGIAHQLMNRSGLPSRYILLCTPALFDRFLAAAGRALAPGESAGPPTADDIARLQAAAPRFGITLLADWPQRGRPR